RRRPAVGRGERQRARDQVGVPGVVAVEVHEVELVLVRDERGLVDEVLEGRRTGRRRAVGLRLRHGPTVTARRTSGPGATRRPGQAATRRASGVRAPDGSVRTARATGRSRAGSLTGAGCRGAESAPRSRTADRTRTGATGRSSSPVRATRSTSR